MPAPIWLAHRLSERLTEVRKNGELAYLRPDGKTQVTVGYDGDRPVSVETVVISSQHAEGASLDQLRADLADARRRARCWRRPTWTSRGPRNILNPAGAFVIGGPVGDAGLTGRKIIVDTYGGMARHGGGAFSGKDPSKVDRSAAYAMRWVAKNVVAAGLAKRAEIQIAYAIGQARPVGTYVETFGTETVDPARISAAIAEIFDLRPRAIIDALDLKRPIYAKTAAHGHFGREDPDFTWERPGPRGRAQGVLQRLSPMGSDPHQLSLLQGFGAPKKVPGTSPAAATNPVAQVLIETSLPHLDRIFDYLVPETLDAEAVPGARVKARFGGQEMSGFITPPHIRGAGRGQARPLGQSGVRAAGADRRVAAVGHRGGGALRRQRQRRAARRHPCARREGGQGVRRQGSGAQCVGYFSIRWRQSRAVTGCRRSLCRLRGRGGLPGSTGRGCRAAGRAGQPQVLRPGFLGRPSSPRRRQRSAERARRRRRCSRCEGPGQPGSGAAAGAGRGPVRAVDRRGRSHAALPELPAVASRRSFRGGRDAVGGLCAGAGSWLGRPVGRRRRPPPRAAFALPACPRSTAAADGADRLRGTVRRCLAQRRGRAAGRERLGLGAHTFAAIPAESDSTHPQYRGLVPTGTRPDAAACTAAARRVAGGPRRAGTRAGSGAGGADRFFAGAVLPRLPTPARCTDCNGPLAQSGRTATPACRWCGRLATNYACPECGSPRLRASVAGALRTAEELGRAFPVPRSCPPRGTTSSPWWSRRRPWWLPPQAPSRWPPKVMPRPCCWTETPCSAENPCGHRKMSCADGFVRPRW